MANDTVLVGGQLFETQGVTVQASALDGTASVSIEPQPDLAIALRQAEETESEVCVRGCLNRRPYYARSTVRHNSLVSPTIWFRDSFGRSTPPGGRVRLLSQSVFLRGFPDAFNTTTQRLGSTSTPDMSLHEELSKEWTPSIDEVSLGVFLESSSASAPGNKIEYYRHPYLSWDCMPEPDGGGMHRAIRKTFRTLTAHALALSVLYATKHPVIHRKLDVWDNGQHAAWSVYRSTPRGVISHNTRSFVPHLEYLLRRARREAIEHPVIIDAMQHILDASTSVGAVTFINAYVALEKLVDFWLESEDHRALLVNEYACDGKFAIKRRSGKPSSVTEASLSNRKPHLWQALPLVMHATGTRLENVLWEPHDKSYPAYADLRNDVFHGKTASMDRVLAWAPRLATAAGRLFHRLVFDDSESDRWLWYHQRPAEHRTFNVHDSTPPSLIDADD